MATYAELMQLRSDTTLRNKVAVACTIKAQSYLVGATPTENQLTWGKTALENPMAQVDKFLSYVLAANKDAAVAAIQAASDATVQTQVDAAVDKLVGGGVI